MAILFLANSSHSISIAFFFAKVQKSAFRLKNRGEDRLTDRPKDQQNGGATLDLSERSIHFCRSHLAFLAFTSSFGITAPAQTIGWPILSLEIRKI